MGIFSEIDMQIREMILDGYTREEIAKQFPEMKEEEIDSYFDNDVDYDDSMDGDAESALASAGFGTDEDYGYYGEE